MRKRFAVTLLFALACNKQPARTPAAATPPPAPRTAAQAEDDEPGNLLNFAHGASVVARSAELTLDQSALRAIDGDPGTAWISPPDDGKDQTIVFALPALTRIEKIGLRTPRAPVFRVDSVQVDASADGANFAPLATLKTADVEGAQLFAVPSRDIQYLRVTTLVANGKFARLESVLAYGRPVRAMAQQPIDGCWSINGFESSFSTDRGRTTGTIGGENRVSFEGGSDGAVYRFIWTSGPDWGFGAMTTAPDGKHLSGLRWYVEPINFSSAESWFGERCARAPGRDVPGAPGDSLKKGQSSETATQFLQRGKRLPLYGLHFTASGGIDEATSAATLELITKIGAPRYKLVSREFRMGSAEGNRKRSQERLDALKAALQKRGVDPSRFQWQAIGSDSPPRPIETEIQRVLYGVIELQPL